MKHTVRIIALMLCLLPGLARAQSADEQYIHIFGLIQEGDTLNAAGQWRPAYAKFTQAREALKKFQGIFPNWSPNVVQYRTGYLSARIAALVPKVPAETLGTTNAPASTNLAAAAAADTGEAVPALKEHLRRLETENSQLTAKLKESLSAQAPAADAKELAKANDAIKALQKENELLKTALEQQQKKAEALVDPAALDTAKKDLADARKQLEQQSRELVLANAEIDVLKKRSVTPPAAAPGLEIKLKDLEKETATLRKDRQDLETRLTRAAADSLKAETAKRKALEDDLASARKDLDTAKKSAKRPASAAAELESLRARLAAYEAKAAPFTAEELAILKATPAPVTLPDAKAPVAGTNAAVAAAPATAPATAPAAKPAKRNYKELPAGVGELFSQARRDFVARRYGDAEKKFQEMLRQDEKNVYLIGFLAAAQIELGHTDDAEKSLKTALALEPQDDQCLFQLGRLRYNQNKMDEAFDALSRSAAGNAENPEVQNLLGATLAEKGQRPAAEAAFRKALVLDPTYPGAHKNLAFLYATQKPASLALARWHYNKALEFGHPQDPAIETLLNAKP